MTSTTPAERIRELMNELETERDNAITSFISQVKALHEISESMHDFEVYPPGIAEEARSLSSHLADVTNRLVRLASTPAQKGV